MSIDTFQARFAFVNLDDGTLTPEAFRVLRTWFKRIGGRDGISSEDLELLATFAAPDAAFAALTERMDALQIQLEQLQAPAAAIAAVRQYAQALEVSYSFVPPLVNWESPGRIGARKANKGSFTTLAASGQITSTVAGGTAPFVVASTTEVANLRAATATTLATARTIGGVSFDGSASITVESATGSFTVGTGFGCNSKTAQTAFALGAAATDLPTVIALANKLRTMSINNGTGS